MSTTRNLITGGAGFLGSNLAKRLLNDGEEVICIDNCCTGNENNIDEFLKSNKFKFFKQDVIDPIDLKVDKIWHLACPASPKNYQKDPVSTLRTSFLGSFNMLELAKKNGSKILLASTSEIYGDPKVHPQPESYFGNVNTTGLRSCYDEGKRVAETLFSDYERTNNIDKRIIRIFNTYGPNMQRDDGRVVSNFINQALEKKDLTIYGDGNQTRSFCYVDDLINGIIAAMDKNYTAPINIGNPKEVTIFELARLIQKKLNLGTKIIYKPLPEDDPMQRCPDISIAKKHLGWQAKISLDDGLDKTIEYFKNNYGQ